MREIKFRAWDNHNKYMFYEGNDPSGKNFTSNDKEYFWKYYGEKPIMQYTGLKDKNGKEIYEGDILEMTAMKYYTGFRKYKTQVLWSEEKLCFGVILKPRKGEDLKDASVRWKSLAWLKSFMNSPKNHNVEIIGNIYENKELLKGRLN